MADGVVDNEHCSNLDVDKLWEEIHTVLGEAEWGEIGDLACRRRPMIKVLKVGDVLCDEVDKLIDEFSREGDGWLSLWCLNCLVYAGTSPLCGLGSPRPGHAQYSPAQAED